MPQIAMETLTRWLTHDAVNTAEHVGQERYWLAWLADNPRIWYRGETEQEAVAVLLWVRNTERLVEGHITIKEAMRLALEQSSIHI